MYDLQARSSHVPDEDLPPPPSLHLQTVALFLDLDGTLAAFESRPKMVGPTPRRTALLQSLHAKLDGRLAILSGRTLEDIDRIVDRSVPAAAGVHGLQRRSADGGVVSQPPHPAIDAVETKLRTFADAAKGPLVERKPQSVALHYRNAPALGDAAVALTEAIARRTGLVLQRGDMVAELRTPGSNKGDALAAFMTEAPFETATPVMVGDDLTDETGFIVAKALGGFGVLVGALRETGARFRLDDVPAVLDWLEAALADRAVQSKVTEASRCPA